MGKLCLKGYFEDNEYGNGDPEIEDRGFGDVGKCAGSVEIDDGGDIVEEAKKG